MQILITGAAGFIGYSVAKTLLERGDEVIGIDNLNDYYSVALKDARLQHLRSFSNFTFHHLDICDHEALYEIANSAKVNKVLHLAAQAGVRYSLQNPYVYAKTNVEGFISVVEMCRRLDKLESFVYASSSSVYGSNTKLPFSESDPVEMPASLYAATKRADELIAQTYFGLYNLPAIGLRFFTVYGPWGRPDMAPIKFAKAIMNGDEIELYNNGDMKRDFTYIDDIVAGILAALDLKNNAPLIYNLGNNHAQKLTYFVEVLENAIGKKANLVMKPMQKGEAKETYADITLAKRDLNFMPKTSIEVGIPALVDWLLRYSY